MDAAASSTRAAARSAARRGVPLEPAQGLFREAGVPADNPITSEKVELGRHVFYDKRLSDNQTFSCASCHKQELAFSDGRPAGLGSTGQSHTRSSMSLANVGYSPTLTWGNPLMTTLERQARCPSSATCRSSSA